MAGSERSPAGGGGAGNPPSKKSGRPPAPAPDEPSKRKKRRKVGEPESPTMDMTPMIDVVFQLLIFFMCATRFKSLEGKLLAYLPKDKGLKNVKIEEQKLPIRVTLTWNVATRQCKVYVGQKYTGIADQDGIRQAERKVKEIKATGTDKAEIDAVSNIPFKYVVETLNMLMRVRLKEISFAAGGGA